MPCFAWRPCTRLQIWLRAAYVVHNLRCPFLSIRIFPCFRHSNATIAPMLLTLKPTTQHGFGSGGPHAYPSPLPTSTTSYFSPQGNSASLPPLPDKLPRRMSTPHRGLPPPAAMTLPNPERGPSTSALSMGQLPAAPSSWQGADESMRNWLRAKSEEDRRKQEEEKTRQESLRLEQRKIEQNMLRESLSGGVPPYMVPMVFAGIGGANMANASLEWTQQYMAQLSFSQAHQHQHQQQQHQQHQQQHQQQQAQLHTRTESDQAQNTRLIAGPQPNPYGPQQLQQVQPNTSVQSGQHIAPQTQQTTGFVPSYQASRAQQPPLQAAPPTSAPRTTAAGSSGLPRLNTVDMQIQPPPPGPLPGQHSIQQGQNSQQQDQQSSPSILFHHWVPPATQASKDPPTPSTKSTHESPYSQNAASHLRSEYQHSPKKRKTTGSHQPGTGSSSNLPETSPSFSQTSSTSTSGRRRGHSRQRSDTSSRAGGAGHEQPLSRRRGRTESGRQSISEAESSSQRQTSAQPETRHLQQRPSGSEMRNSSRDLIGSNERIRNSSPKRESEPIS